MKDSVKGQTEAMNRVFANNIKTKRNDLGSKCNLH